MDLFEMLKNAIAGHQVPSDEVIEKTWVQVGRLSPTDEGRRRSLAAATDARKREFEMLEKKKQALKAQNAAESDEWWFDLHKNYGLPEGNYHLADDGRIFVQPKEKKNDA